VLELKNKLSALFLSFLLVVSVYPVLVVAQEPDPLDIVEDSGVDSSGCAAVLCQEGFTCEETDGVANCVPIEGYVPPTTDPNNFKGYNCGDEESWDFVSQECKGFDFNYVGEYERPGFFGGFASKLRIAFANEEDKVRLSSIVAAQNIAEFERAVKEGDENAIISAAEDIRKVFADSGTYLEEYADSVEYDDYVPYNHEEGNYQSYREMKWREMQNIDKFNEIKRVLLEKVANGEISQERAEEAIEEVEISLGELSVVLEHSEDLVVDKIVDSSGGEVTELEIDYYNRASEKDFGMENRFYVGVVNTRNIALNRFKLDELKAKITESDEHDFGDVGQLFQQARMELQDARNGLRNEDYGNAVEGYRTTEYIVNHLEKYLEEGENALDNVHEIVDISYEELNDKIEEEAEQVKEDYEVDGVRDKIVEEHPEFRNQVDKTYTEAVEVIDLVEVIKEIEEVEIEKLKFEGETEEEAVEEIERLKSREYFYEDGGKYIPEGFVDISDEDGDGNVDFRYGGGFMKGFSYEVYNENADTVVYGATGYTWDSPLTGSEHRQKYPLDYEPETYRTGEEKFGEEVEIGGEVITGYPVETEKGLIIHQYTSTGYRVLNEEGVIKEVLYSETKPEYEAVGGCVIRPSPLGMDVIYDGEATRWTVNPETGVWGDVATGKKFSPEVPIFDTEYNPEERVYVYNVGPNEWRFNPETDTFMTGEDVEINVPVPQVPVGLEDEVDSNGEIILDHGETWRYEEEGGIWTSINVDEDTGEAVEKEFVISPNEEFRYDEEKGVYIDSTGDIHDEAVFVGQTWEKTGSDNWYADDGRIYEPGTGTTINSEGDVIGDEEDEVGDIGSYGVVYEFDEDEEKTEVQRNRFRVGGRFVYRPGETVGARPNYVYVSSGVDNYDSENPEIHEVLDADGNVVEKWTQDFDGRWRVEGTTGREGYHGYENYYQEGIGGRNAETGYYNAEDGTRGIYFYDRETGEQRYIAPNTEEYEKNGQGARRGFFAQGGPGYVGAYHDYYDPRENRNYNFVDGDVAYYLPPGTSPENVNLDSYRVDSPYGYDPAHGTDFGAFEVGSDYFRADDGSDDLIYFDSITGAERRVNSDSDEYAQAYAESDEGFRGYYAYNGPGSSTSYGGGYYSGGYPGGGTGGFGERGYADSTYTDEDGTTYSRTASGDWLGSDGANYDNPPGYEEDYTNTYTPPRDVGDFGYGHRDYSYEGTYAPSGGWGYYDPGSGSVDEYGNYIDSSNYDPAVAATYPGGACPGGDCSYGNYNPDTGYPTDGGPAVYGSDGYDQYGAYNPSQDTSGAGGGYYEGGNYYPSSGYDSYGSYYDGSTQTYSEGYDSGGYGDSYDGYTDYSAGADYSGGDYSGGDYSGGSGGDYSGGDGSYYGGDSGGSGGGEGTGGGDSGSYSGGGESGGGESSGGESGGGGGEGGSGAVIAEEDFTTDNWLVRFFRRLFGG
jgi:hypothetical protein